MSLTRHAAVHRRDALMNGGELLLGRHARARPALVCGERQMSYGELRDRAARAAALWRSLGMRTGARVAIKLPDGFDWVVAWLGVVWAGGVAVGVNPRVPAGEWESMLDEARFRLIVAESASEVPPRWRARVVEVAAARRELRSQAPIPAVRRPPQAPAFWVHTSGTSGRPKGVVHAHRSLRDIARISTGRIGVMAGDRLFSSSRLFFTYPLVNVLLAGLRAGAVVLLDPRWPSPATLAECVAALRPHVLFSVPSLYRDLLREGLATLVREAGVRRCVSAGEALSASLRTQWQRESGLPMIDGYGASETLTLVLTAAPDDPGLMPSPGVRVRALDPGAAAAGLPTRLRIRVATLALGYHDRPAARVDSIRGGEFCPSDLFVPTGERGWRFAGREDSLVKIRGRWVDLGELESRLATGIPGLREAAAARAADADGVDALAFFFAADDAEAARTELEARIAALPHYQRPAWIQVVDALPRTATGKLVRRRLPEKFSAAPPR